MTTMDDRDQDRLVLLDRIAFEIEWETLAEDERDDCMALLNQRIAHGEERLEAITETTVP
jgi:hypothetical protein